MCFLLSRHLHQSIFSCKSTSRAMTVCQQLPDGRAVGQNRAWSGVSVLDLAQGWVDEKSIYNVRYYRYSFWPSVGTFCWYLLEMNPMAFLIFAINELWKLCELNVLDCPYYVDSFFNHHIVDTIRFFLSRAICTNKISPFFSPLSRSYIMKF